MTDLVRRLLLFATFAATCAADPWRIIGPGGGGAMFRPTISPHSDQTVLVACDMTGSYVTHDGGSSWKMFSLADVSRWFAYDPQNAKTLYAGTSNAVYRSRDAGRTWSVVYPPMNTVKKVLLRGDHAEGEWTTDPPAGMITAFSVDPAKSTTLYAAQKRGAAYRLLISTDDGQTWKPDASLPGGRALYADPRRPGDLYVLGDTTSAQRRDGQWFTGEPMPPALDVSLGFPATGSPVAYAVSKEGTHLSTDGGLTWTRLSVPGQPKSVRAVATSLRHPEVAYVSYSGLKTAEGDTFGVLRTLDRGTTWEVVWQETDTRAAANIHDNWITPALGPEWGEHPLTMGVSPQHPDLVYGTDLGRTLRSTDGGKTWQGVYSKQSGEGWTSTGLDVTNAYGLHFDPFDQRRRFITYTDIGLFRSEDGGQGWRQSLEGAPKQWWNTTYWVEFDPKVKGRMWAVMSDTHDLPRPKMWRGKSPSRYRGGVVRSDDGGRTWVESSQGMPPAGATHILLDPASPPDARVLYVATMGRGVFKSVDGGKTWSAANQGLPEKEPFAWRLTRDPRGTLYLVVARRSSDGKYGNDQDGALYRSTDNAATWTRMALPEGVNGPNGLAVDPRDPQRLYLAAWGRNIAEPKQGGGIWLSEDAGAHWRNVLDRDQHVYDITPDPRRPGTLYACGFSSSVWRSTDRGQTWQRLRGYEFKWGQRVILDPVDPAKIYVTTFGGSIWHGPAAGDPRAVESVATVLP